MAHMHLQKHPLLLQSITTITRDRTKAAVLNQAHDEILATDPNLQTFSKPVSAGFRTTHAWLFWRIYGVLQTRATLEYRALSIHPFTIPLNIKSPKENQD